MMLWLPFWSIEFEKLRNCRTGFSKMKLWPAFWSIDFAKLRNARTGFLKMMLWPTFWSIDFAKLRNCRTKLRHARTASQPASQRASANAAKLEIEDPYGRFVAWDSKVNYPKARN